MVLCDGTPQTNPTQHTDQKISFVLWWGCCIAEPFSAHTSLGCPRLLGSLWPSEVTGLLRPLHYWSPPVLKSVNKSLLCLWTDLISGETISLVKPYIWCIWWRGVIPVQSETFNIWKSSVAHLNRDENESNMSFLGIRWRHEKAPVMSLETSPQLKCLYASINIPLGPVSGSGLEWVQAGPYWILIIVFRHSIKGDHFEALRQGVLIPPSESRCIQVGLKFVSVQVCVRTPRQKCFFSAQMLWHKKLPDYEQLLQW